MALRLKDFDDEIVAHSRLMFVIAARENFEMHHCDISTAFSDGVLKEGLYTTQSPNYCETFKRSKKEGVFVYRLSKSIYGLKQTSQKWNETISKVLKALGSKTCINEPYL